MTCDGFWDRFEERSEAFSRRVARATPAGAPEFLLIVLVGALFGFPGGLGVWIPLLIVLALATHIVSRHVHRARFLHWFYRLRDGSSVYVGEEVYVKSLGYWTNNTSALTDEEMLALSENSTGDCSFRSAPAAGVARMKR